MHFNFIFGMQLFSLLVQFHAIWIHDAGFKGIGSMADNVEHIYEEVLGVEMLGGANW